ncbi:MAG: hypothetical protein ACXAE3_09710 [Candidatus Kariarchaeaceae archaeon]|jgi:hypothetical protein
MAGMEAVYMGVQIVLLVGLIFGSIYGRRLQMYWHHRLIYTVMLGELIVFLLWMGPGVLYYSGQGLITTILALHITVGSLSAISTAVLAYTFLKRRNRYDLPTLRWTRPLMIFTLFVWILAFTLGTIFYVQTYL